MGKAIRKVLISTIITIFTLGAGVMMPNVNINKRGHAFSGDSFKAYAESNLAETSSKTIAIGPSSFVIKSDGTLWACGFNSYGQLGDGTIESKFSWEKVNSGVSQIVCGEHSLALKSDGTLLACGLNNYGQLGDGTKINKSSWEQVGSGYSQIACGEDHSLAIKSDGTLWACGYNEFGQLGDGTKINKSSWEQVGSGYSQIACGEYYSMAMKTDGTLWTTGYNGHGQLGDGTTVDKSSWEQVGSGYSQIACGENHSLAIKSDGTLWACGDNYYGQLGDGTTTCKYSWEQVGSGFNQVACGESHSMAIKTDGTLWTCGYNNRGQLGDGTTNNKLSWEQIGTNFSKIAGGSYNSLALKTDGTLWGTGFNAYGELGDGTKSNILSLKVIGDTNVTDTTAPTSPTINVSGNQLTIIGGSDAGSGVRETDYQINGGAWSEYTSPITLADGTYTINAKTVDNTGNISLVVTKEITISSTISLNKTIDDLMVGDTDTLTAVVMPNETKNIKWTSGDPSVVTVDENGKITAVKEGTAVITALTKDGRNLSASCTINVEIRTTKLVIKAVNNTVSEYRLTKDELNNFLEWYYERANGATDIPYYVFTIPAKGSIPPHKEYITFDNIESFEVQ